MTLDVEVPFIYRMCEKVTDHRNACGNSKLLKQRNVQNHIMLDSFIKLRLKAKSIGNLSYIIRFEGYLFFSNIVGAYQMFFCAVTIQTFSKT